MESYNLLFANHSLLTYEHSIVLLPIILSLMCAGVSEVKFHVVTVGRLEELSNLTDADIDALISRPYDRFAAFQSGCCL